MHILFLTLAYPLSGSNLYTDFVDELANHGHFITVCIQDETRKFGALLVSYRKNICIVSIPTGQITKTSFFRKGINTLLLEYRFFKKLSQIEFYSLDVLLYSTPPITFYKIIFSLKKKYNTINYLLLKDIFPQNAVDLKIIKENSLLHKYFRRKEKKLYQYSDVIGCMSLGNMRYLLENNNEIEKGKITITPNCIYPRKIINPSDKATILKTYDIPLKTMRLIYGGNIGKPQGVDFIIKCINIIKNYSSVSLTIVGNGTEFYRLKKIINGSFSNVKLFDALPNDAYHELLACMDVGLVFLDNKFTIPNFPSRILDYMNYSMPLIACTDIVCDVKQEICDEGAGFWCRSDDVEGFRETLDNIIDNRDILVAMGKKSREIFNEKYSVQIVVKNVLHEIESLRKAGQ